MPRRRLRSLVRLRVVSDRYRCGEVWLQPTYEYEGGATDTGEAHRIALGESVAACAGDVWEFLFESMAEAQEEAAEVVLALEVEREGWAQALVEGLALAAARELGMAIEHQRTAEDDAGQLELWEPAGL